MRLPTVQLYMDAQGMYRWRRVAANGNVMADSAEGYVRGIGCLKAAKTCNRRPYRLA